MELRTDKIDEVTFETSGEHISMTAKYGENSESFEMKDDEFGTYAMNIHKVYLAIQNILGVNG